MHKPKKISCQKRSNAACLRNRWPLGNGDVPGGPHPTALGEPDAARAGAGYTTGFSLVATVACYLGTLIIAPLIALGFLCSGFVEPWSLILVIVELIVAPLLVSRILLWTPWPSA